MGYHLHISPRVALGGAVVGNLFWLCVLTYFLGTWAMLASPSLVLVTVALLGANTYRCRRDHSPTRDVSDDRADTRALVEVYARDGDHIPLSRRAEKAWTGPNATREQMLAWLHSRSATELRGAVDHLTAPPPVASPEENAAAALDAYQRHITGLAAANMDPDEWIAEEARLRAALVAAGDVADIYKSKSLNEVARVLKRKEGRNA